jgi:hypothetical protein
MDGDPAEVRVPIALRVQANSKTLEREGVGPRGMFLNAGPPMCGEEMG